MSGSHSVALGADALCPRGLTLRTSGTGRVSVTPAPDGRARVTEKLTTCMTGACSLDVGGGALLARFADLTCSGTCGVAGVVAVDVRLGVSGAGTGNVVGDDVTVRCSGTATARVEAWRTLSAFASGVAGVAATPCDIVRRSASGPSTVTIKQRSAGRDGDVAGRLAAAAAAAGACSKKAGCSGPAAGCSPPPAYETVA